jgi:predicted aspartyl protease
MLEGGFVANASSLKPRPSLLYLKAKINGQNVSCLVDTGATHSFMNSRLTKDLGLPTGRAGKSINVCQP